MANKVYKFWRAKPTEAWYQLSEEEQNKHTMQMQESLHKVGGKTLLQCAPVWASEEWLLCGVEEFPNIEAVQRHAEFSYQLNHFRYFNGESMLGTKWPPA